MRVTTTHSISSFEWPVMGSWKANNSAPVKEGQDEEKRITQSAGGGKTLRIHCVLECVLMNSSKITSTMLMPDTEVWVRVWVRRKAMVHTDSRVSTVRESSLMLLYLCANLCTSSKVLCSPVSSTFNVIRVTKTVRAEANSLKESYSVYSLLSVDLKILSWRRCHGPG